MRNSTLLLGALVLGGAAGILSLLQSPPPASARKPTPEGPPPPREGPRQRIILCFGDSLSTGNPPYWKYISTPIDTLIDGKGWGGQMVNAIMNGFTPKGGKKQPGAIAIIAKTHPTDVVLLAGVNDIASGKTPAKIIADLQKAWDAIHAADARVIAVKLTPWFGYGKYFGKGKKSAQMFRDVTNAVNAYIDQKTGTPGGPDKKVETSPMGDSEGRLLKEFSAGGLHLSKAGQKALAALVAKAL